MTNQQRADALLRQWRIQREMGIRPEQRKLIEQDNEPGFYDWQILMVAQQMDARP